MLGSVLFGCDSRPSPTPEEAAKASANLAQTIKDAEDESKAEMSKRGKKGATVKFGRKPGMNPGGGTPE
jgi:hypothetical protein